MCYRELCCHFSIDLIAYTYRNLIQVSKYIQNCKRYICRTLHPASVLGSNTVKPSHTSRTSCCRSEFTAVSSAASQLISFLAENLADKCTCSYCTGVCLAYCNDLFDLIRRDSRSDRTVCRQCGRRCYHRINSVIRIFQRTELSFQKNLFAFFDCIVQIQRNITYKWCYHVSVLCQFFI